MSEQPIKRKEEEDDAEDEVGSNGHFLGISTATESETMKSRPNQRRRRAISSTSSSKGSLSVCSWPQGISLGRAFLISRRTGSSTPVPSWKVSDNSILNASFEHHHHHSLHLKHDRAVQGLHISARKLAAALWELQKLPFSEATVTKESLGSEPQDMDNTTSPIKQSPIPHGLALSPASSRISKRSHKRSPVHVKFEDSGKSHVTLERRKGQQVMPVTAASDNEITGDGIATSPSNSIVLGSRDAFSKLGCQPTTTSELLNVLNHVWSLEEQHDSSMSLVGALRIELEDARLQLQELLSNEKAHSKGVENINRRIAEEQALWQGQHEQSIRIAVQSVRQELEDERKSKQKLEMLQKKLVKEFRGAKKTIARAMEDLDRERKARQLMEEVCDELAREIGQDKSRVEELKRESVKVLEEVEEERKMLQMAEVWREERVQMKLMEAKLELEEKNMALDKLRSQLEAFLETKRAGELKDAEGHATGVTRLADAGRGSVEVIVGRNLLDPFHLRDQRVVMPGRNSLDSGRIRGMKQSAWMSASEDDDDLHSIELDRGSLAKTASSKWSGQLLQERESEYQERRFSEEQMLFGSEPESKGIERSRSEQRDKKERHDTKAEDAAPGCILQGYRCTGHDVESREQRQEQRGGSYEGRRVSSKSWQSDMEDSGSHMSVSPRGMSRSIQGQSESIMRAACGNSNSVDEKASKSGEWQQQIYDHGSRWQPNLLDAPANYGSNGVSSPTRKWNNHMPHWDFKSKPSNEALYDGSSLKTKLLEAKLEGQHPTKKKAVKSI